MLPPRLRRRAAHCRRERGIEERRAPPFSHEVGGPENGYAMCPLMVSRVPRLDSPTRVDTSQSAAGLRGGQGGRVPRPRRAMIVAVSITGQYEYRGAVSDSPPSSQSIYLPQPTRPPATAHRRVAPPRRGVRHTRFRRYTSFSGARSYKARFRLSLAPDFRLRPSVGHTNAPRSQESCPHARPGHTERVRANG